jgi:hypothetical protein
MLISIEFDPPCFPPAKWHVQAILPDGIKLAGYSLQPKVMSLHDYEVRNFLWLFNQLVQHVVRGSDRFWLVLSMVEHALSHHK